MGPTAAVARFAVEADPLRDAPEVRQPALRALADTLGVALGGSAEPVAASVAAYVRDQAARRGCALWGTDGATTPALAALANATAAHALDFDDISHTMRGRPSAATLPAVLAVAEQVHASGAQALAAYVVAVEVTCKLGSVSAQPTYERGWQTSCTLGVIGAACGAARLLGLDARTTEHAIGLAVAQAAGSRRSFGSMAKPYQVGHASQAGVQAAELAARGVSGGANALEGEAGYFALYANPVADVDLAARLGRPYDLVAPGFNVKLYPCGGAAHPAIEAVLSATDGVAPSDVERIVVDVPYTAPLIAHQQRPATGLAAKFSLPYILAAAVLDRQIGLRQFTDAAVQRPEAQALMARVEARVPPDMQKGAQPWPPSAEGRVEVHLRGGGVRRGTTVVRRGQGTLTPLTDAEIEAKFLDCAHLVMSEPQARQVFDLTRRFDHLADVAELTRRLAV